MTVLRVLVACEFSGTVRRAFRARGHDAYSCDLLEAADGERAHHIQGDVLEQLSEPWDMVIAHPPCTYLSASGLHWNARRPERASETARALEFVRLLMSAPLWRRLALENPVGCISSEIRKPDQIVHPHHFGDDASKATCLWLKGLPPLLSTAIPAGRGRVVRGRERWSNQTDSGQNKLAPSADRWALRSATYPGIAAAMADQWGAQ